MFITVRAPADNNWWRQIFSDFKRLNLSLSFYRVDNPRFLTELPQLVSLSPPWKLCEEYNLKDEERKTPAEGKNISTRNLQSLRMEVPSFLKARRVARTKEIPGGKFASR